MFSSLVQIGTLFWAYQLEYSIVYVERPLYVEQFLQIHECRPEEGAYS